MNIKTLMRMSSYFLSTLPIFCTYVGAFFAILHPNACKILASNPVTFARRNH